MLRSAVVIVATLAVMLPCASSFALTAKAKMATCKFGADDQKLEGTVRRQQTKILADEENAL
jgi:hypothetical protein